MRDTNTLRHLGRAHPAVAQRLVAVPMATLCLSNLGEAELLSGLALPWHPAPCW